MENIDWEEIRERFERKMEKSLRGLPGHREVSPDLFEFRSMISHEIPETSSTELFQKLIQILLRGDKVDPVKIRAEYLIPEVNKETKVLKERKTDFKAITKSALDWVRSNLLEEELQRQWINHETWLPRRYTIYANPNVPFQTIAADTLSRYYLIISTS